jgi:hypothetical protein
LSIVPTATTSGGEYKELFQNCANVEYLRKKTTDKRNNIHHYVNSFKDKRDKQENIKRRSKDPKQRFASAPSPLNKNFCCPMSDAFSETSHKVLRDNPLFDELPFQITN